MNIFKYYCVIVFVLNISFLHAMEVEKCLKLSIIEKQLILKEVEKQGKDKILAEIYKEGEKQTPLAIDCDDRERRIYWRDHCTAFHVSKIFYKKDRKKDSLTKQIFDTIKVIEKEKGYCPEMDCDTEFTILGERTYYWWLQDNEDNFLPEIQVKFRPHYYNGDQKAVEEVVRNAADQKKEKYLKLSTIEKQLILKEVGMQGKEHLLAEVCKDRKNGPMKYDQEAGNYFWKIPAALKIKAVFYKANSEKDSLTKEVFDAIQEIERRDRKGLNRPEYDYGRDADSSEYLLGRSTNYKWMKDAENNDDISAVQIRSYFKARSYDQKGLEKFIQICC